MQDMIKFKAHSSLCNKRFERCQLHGNFISKNAKFKLFLFKENFEM